MVSISSHLISNHLGAAKYPTHGKLPLGVRFCFRIIFSPGDCVMQQPTRGNGSRFGPVRPNTIPSPDLCLSRLLSPPPGPRRAPEHPPPRPSHHRCCRPLGPWGLRRPSTPATAPPTSSSGQASPPLGNASPPWGTGMRGMRSGGGVGGKEGGSVCPGLLLAAGASSGPRRTPPPGGTGDRRRWLNRSHRFFPFPHSFLSQNPLTPDRPPSSAPLQVLRCFEGQPEYHSFFGPPHDPLTPSSSHDPLHL